MTNAEACERVRRFRRIATGRDVLIDSAIDYETHWLITYGVTSLEDSSRVFKYGTVIVEKNSGNLYYPPSRSARPIDFAAFPSNRQEFVQITPGDLDKLEAEHRPYGN